MKRLTKFVASLGIATMATASFADINLTAETASPGVRCIYRLRT